MACSSVTIKQEHTGVTYVHPSSQVLPKEVKRERSHAPSQPAIQVCPINVVQGDSILVKLKYKEGMFNSKFDDAYSQQAGIHWSMGRLYVRPLH